MLGVIQSVVFMVAKDRRLTQLCSVVFKKLAADLFGKPPYVGRCLMRVDRKCNTAELKGGERTSGAFGTTAAQ